MLEDSNNPTPLTPDQNTADLEARIGTASPGAYQQSQQPDPGQQPFVQDQGGFTQSVAPQSTPPEIGQPTTDPTALKSLLTNFFGQHGVGGYLMNSFGMPTPEQRQIRQQSLQLKQQMDQSQIQLHQATAKAIDLGNQEITIPQAPLPDGTPQPPLVLPQKYATPALIQTLKNAAKTTVPMTTIGPEHVSVNPKLQPLLGQQYPTMLLDKSILGTAAQQNKVENAPAKPLKVGYDQGIPVSVTDSQGTTYDINDPNLPQALKPIVQSAQNAHKQHLNEAAQSQARAFGQQMKMNEVKQGNLTNSTKTMIEAAPKVIDFVDRIDKLVDEQKAQLGPAAGRWNEFMTGKVGAPNPGFTKLRTNVGLMTTLLMRMHVGARGGEYIMKHFQDLVDSGKQSPENMHAALGEIRQYAQDVASEAPARSPVANAPSGGTIRVQLPDGRTGTVPASSRRKYESMPGAKILP